MGVVSASKRFGSRIGASAQRIVVNFRAGPAPMRQVSFMRRIDQWKAVILLPFVVFISMVTTRVLHGVVVDLLSFGSGNVAAFLGPIFGVAFVVGLAWLWYAWVATAGFGFMITRT